jgi:hypothetical protein
MRGNPIYECCNYAFVLRQLSMKIILQEKFVYSFMIFTFAW